MNVTLRQLRAFLAVARTGSFTLAAESLYITQSALSGLIKELEQTLAARLLDRSTRRVHLTEIGERLYPLLDGLLNDLDSALRQVGEQREMRTGLVRVAASQLLASALLPALIAEFQTIYPMIQVRLVDTRVEAVMASVFSGEVELGIGPEREPNSDITSTRLFDGPFMVVLPPEHALAKRKRLRWEDLASQSVIALQGQFTERLLHDLHAAAPQLGFSPSMEVAFMSTMLSMIKTGLGVGLCIPYAAPLVEMYGLQMRLLVQPQVYRSFDVLTRRGRTLSPAAQRFLDFIGPKVRGMPYLR
jgi:DNA-binding transcriptional LysR family regulator